MEINHGTSERAMQVLYEQRINGLGKCLLLWASLYSEFGSSDPWHYTELAVNNLMLLITDMACRASQINDDQEPKITVSAFDKYRDVCAFS